MHFPFIFSKPKTDFTFWDMPLNEKSVINANNLILLTDSNSHLNYIFSVVYAKKEIINAHKNPTVPTIVSITVQDFKVVFSSI